MEQGNMVKFLKGTKRGNKEGNKANILRGTREHRYPLGDPQNYMYHIYFQCLVNVPATVLFLSPLTEIFHLKGTLRIIDSFDI